MKRVLQILLISLSVSLLSAKPLTAEADHWVNVPYHGPVVEGPGPVLPEPAHAERLVVPEEKEAVVAIEREGGCVLSTAGHVTEVITGVDDAGMELVGKLQMLARFSAYMAGFTDRGMAALSKLHKLETIEITSNKITDAGIDCLRGLRNVKKLTLNCARLTDKGLKAL